MAFAKSAIIDNPGHLRAGHGEDLAPLGAAGHAGHPGRCGRSSQPSPHLAGRAGHAGHRSGGPVQRLLWLHSPGVAGVHCGYGDANFLFFVKCSILVS